MLTSPASPPSERDPERLVFFSALLLAADPWRDRGRRASARRGRLGCSRRSPGPGRAGPPAARGRLPTSPRTLVSVTIRGRAVLAPGPPVDGKGLAGPALDGGEVRVCGPG